MGQPLPPPPAPAVPGPADPSAMAAQQQAALLADLQRRFPDLFPVTPPGMTPAPPGPVGAPAGPTLSPPTPVGPLAPPGPPPEMPPVGPAAGPGLVGPSFAPPVPGGAGGLPPAVAPAVGPTGPQEALPGQENLPVPLSPEEAAEQARLAMEGELEREAGAQEEGLGQGRRPRRGSTMEHPLDRASAQLRDELQANARRLAADLFPNGPAGTVMPSKQALGAYMRRHWDDPQFRSAMLDRMAPKGPDGARVPWGVRAFTDLYRQHVAPYRLPPQPPQPPAPSPPMAPPPMPPQPQMPPTETGVPAPPSPFALGPVGQ
jgi:hypothetical protein